MWIIVRGWRDKTPVREAMRLAQPCDARNCTAILKLFSPALLCGFQIGARELNLKYSTVGGWRGKKPPFVSRRD